MTTGGYTPASSAGWLDLDAAASERVAVLLRSLEQPGTLDPLGLGTIRDAFSARLSPGTSTVQTRLRYFVFLPWIFRRLEETRVEPARFADRLRDLEARLIDCLRHLGPDQGVIGISAGRDIIRMPSVVYWSGLGSWGLRRHDLSIGEYGKRAAAFGRARPARDDDGNVTHDSATMWLGTPPEPPDFLAEQISLALEPHEAQLLVDQIRQRHPESLLAELCARPGAAASADFAWDLRGTGLPARLEETLRHAQCFSELTVGPQHLYNVLLARKARSDLGWDTERVEHSETQGLAAWAQRVAERHDELLRWVEHLPELWALLGADANVPESTKAFVTRVARRAVQDPGAFADDGDLAALLTAREVQLKTGRARLANRSALEAWKQDAFGGQLDFRWRITRSYLADIADGLARAG